ncbi:hypothetical protein DB346_17760 [Verrucomicrobia bacterium LW23]|nr:hypothetical protein DB346_17760 [Verrucomicrobia bacterium LW23]
MSGNSLPDNSATPTPPEGLDELALGARNANADLEAAGSGRAETPELRGIAFPFRFIFTVQEFGLASAYHFSWKFRYLFWPARIVGLFLIFGVAVAWGHTPPALSWWAGLLQLFSGMVMLTYVQILVWMALRSFRTSRLHGLQMSVIVRGDGLHIRTGPPGTGAGQPGAAGTRHVAWDNFTEAVIFPGGVILYQTKGTFHWLPYTGMLSPQKSVEGMTREQAEAMVAAEKERAKGAADSSIDPIAAAVESIAAGSPTVNPTQLLEDFLRLHVPRVDKM